MTLKEVFSGRRVHVDWESAPGATTRFLKFKGTRDVATSVSIVGFGDVRAHTIGSVYYAWLSVDERGGTRATLSGKPTVDGKEPCSPSDWANVDCDRTAMLALRQVKREDVTGREENEAISSVIAELRKTCVGPLQGAARPVPPPAFEPMSPEPAE
jgi:hypothetical protein